MIIFRIIQNASESFCEKDDVYKNLTSVTLSGRLEKLYDRILNTLISWEYDNTIFLIIIMVFRCDLCLIARHLDNNFKKTQSS